MCNFNNLGVSFLFPLVVNLQAPAEFLFDFLFVLFTQKQLFLQLSHFPIHALRFRKPSLSFLLNLFFFSIRSFLSSLYFFQFFHGSLMDVLDGVIFLFQLPELLCQFSNLILQKRDLTTFVLATFAPNPPALSFTISSSIFWCNITFRNCQLLQQSISLLEITLQLCG